MKRVGFMIGQVEDEDTRPRLSALRLGLEALGWVEGELGGRGDGGVYACADCIKEPGGIQQAITDHITGFRAYAEKTHRLHRISTRPS